LANSRAVSLSLSRTWSLKSRASTPTMPLAYAAHPAPAPQHHAPRRRSASAARHARGFGDPAACRGLPIARKHRHPHRPDQSYLTSPPSLPTAVPPDRPRDRPHPCSHCLLANLWRIRVGSIVPRSSSDCVAVGSGSGDALGSATMRMRAASNGSSAVVPRISERNARVRAPGFALALRTRAPDSR
jgi:hypothetical protein